MELMCLLTIVGNSVPCLYLTKAQKTPRLAAIHLFLFIEIIYPSGEPW